MKNGRYLLLLVLFPPLVTFSQEIKFHGLYISESSDSVASYLRFYPDGTVLAASTTASTMKVADWLTYENRNGKNLTRGFYQIESEEISIPLLQQFDNKLFLKKGRINGDGTNLLLTSYRQDQGMVKKYGIVTYKFSPID